jgi:hypothetical protein
MFLGNYSGKGIAVFDCLVIRLRVAGANRFAEFSCGDFAGGEGVLQLAPWLPYRRNRCLQSKLSVSALFPRNVRMFVSHN